MRVLVTGAAGFIGMHVTLELLRRGDEVVGVDNLNSYYEVSLKEARLRQLREYKNFQFAKIDLGAATEVGELFERPAFDCVVHLAAQAGVRYSLKNPLAYVNSNVTGFAHVLEGCRRTNVRHLLFASSSSVYGGNTALPFSVNNHTDHPLSLYAATKKANEMMAHSYAHLYGIPCTGLRLFTVYGPWGRPDMAYFIFTRAILEGRPIRVFNEGRMERDFTYVADVVDGIVGLVERPAVPDPFWNGDAPDPSRSFAPYRLYNIGNRRPVSIPYFVEILEQALGRKAKREYVEMQPGDVSATHADVEDLVADIGYSPSTKVEEGVAKFVKWYREYYDV